jgi:hypothetical protein
MDETASRPPEVQKDARSAPAASEPEEEQLAEQAGSDAGLVARLLTPKWLLALLAASLVGHVVGFISYQLATKPPSIGCDPEVPLGQFRFAPDPSDGGHVTEAEFSLHIALLGQVEPEARRALEAKRLRVQQAVEELVRQAHSGDFEDPLLGDLKRMLQEQINQTLGIRAIADVIITDLKLERNAKPVGPMSETADSMPWAENPSG